MSNESKRTPSGRKTLPKNIMSSVNTVGVKTKKSVMNFFSRGHTPEESAPETPPKQMPGSLTDIDPVSAPSTSHGKHSSSFKQRIRRSLSGCHENSNHAVVNATTHSPGREASSHGTCQDRARSPEGGTPSKRGNFKSFLSNTVGRGSGTRSGGSEGQPHRHSLEAEDYNRLVPLPNLRPSLDLNLPSTSIGSLTIEQAPYHSKVMRSSPIPVFASAGNGTSKVLDTFGIGEMETTSFSVGTIPDSPAPLLKSSVQHSIMDDARLSRSVISRNERTQGLAGNFIPTPMPGTNLALDESYEIKSPSCKALHSSLGPIDQTKQQNAMSYFVCLSGAGDRFTCDDCQLVLENTNAQDLLVGKESTRNQSATLPTETLPSNRSVQSSTDHKSGHTNHITEKWCSDDPFAPTSGSPAFPVLKSRFDEPVLERRPQPSYKPLLLFKPTNSLCVPSSSPTMNFKHSSLTRAENSLGSLSETSGGLLPKFRDTTSSISSSSDHSEVPWTHHSDVYDGLGYDFGFDPPTDHNLSEEHSNEQENLEKDTLRNEDKQPYEPDDINLREFEQQEWQLERANHPWLIVEMIESKNERFRTDITHGSTKTASPTASPTDRKLKSTSKGQSDFRSDSSPKMDSQKSFSSPSTTQAGSINALSNIPKHPPSKENNSTIVKQDAEAARPATNNMKPFPVWELPDSNPILRHLHLAAVPPQSRASYVPSHWGDNLTPEAGSEASEAHMNELLERIQQDMLKTEVETSHTQGVVTAFKNHTRMPQTQDPIEQARNKVPYAPKYDGVFKTNAQRIEEAKKDSIRKAMHRLKNLKAMAVIMQDHPIATGSIAHFSELYECIKADATFWADQAAALDGMTVTAGQAHEVEDYSSYESLAENFQEVAEMMRQALWGARAAPHMTPKRIPDSPPETQTSVNESGDVTTQTKDATYTPSNSTIERRQSSESIQTVFRSLSTDDA